MFHKCVRFKHKFIFKLASTEYFHPGFFFPLRNPTTAILSVSNKTESQS